MQTLNDLEQYVGRKELSKSSKEDITKIFCTLESDIKLEDIVAKLLKFQQEIIGNYILQVMGQKSEIEKDEFIAVLIKKIVPIKFGHLFRAYRAFACLDDYKRAFELLFSKMETDLIGNNINKLIFQGLDKTIKECGFVTFLVAFGEEQKRNLNIFAAFLLKYFAYNKNSTLISDIIKFHELNNLPTPKELMAAEMTPEVVKEVEHQAEAKVYTVEEHLQIAAKLCGEMKLVKENQDEELKKLKTEIVSRNSEVVELKGKLSRIENHYNSLNETLDRTKIDLLETKTAKTELERKNVDLHLRLDNISSGYGAAGHQEIESLKGILKSRLRASFDKFIEIKNEQPDMGYYNILILTLDEIQKTLKKNGIEI